MSSAVVKLIDGITNDDDLLISENVQALDLQSVSRHSVRIRRRVNKRSTHNRQDGGLKGKETPKGEQYPFCSCGTQENRSGTKETQLQHETHVVVNNIIKGN